MGGIASSRDETSYQGMFDHMIADDTKTTAVRAREPVQKRARETRSRIIDAAGYIFAEYGFEAATTTMIAERADTSIGSLYTHFTDKIEIFLEILAAHSEAVYRYAEGQVMGIVERGEPPDVAFDRLVPGLFQAHMLAGKLNYEMNRFVVMNEEAMRINAEWEAREDVLIVRFLDHFRDRMKTEDIESAAVIIHRSFHEVFIHLFRNRGRVDEGRILSEFVRMLKGGILK
jgi:AcrR family transcriptional regulator